MNRWDSICARRGRRDVADLLSGKNSKSRFQMNGQIPSKTDVEPTRFFPYGTSLKSNIEIQESPLCPTPLPRFSQQQ
jgi:hypothetical protein